MSGSKAALSVSIAVIDAGSAKIDAFNKRLKEMQAPADRFNKSMAKFGELTGITRSADQIRAVGDSALETARSLERMVSPLGLLTSAASLAGMAAMTKQWAEAGTTLGQLAYRMETPVGELSKLRIGAHLAGVSVEAASGSLEGLREKIRQVAYKQAPAGTMTIWNQMGLHAGTPEHVAQTMDVMREMAGYIGTLKQPGAQKHALQQFGMEAWLPMMKDGIKGFDLWMDKAEKTGAVMGPGMAKNADELRESIAGVSERLKGLTNQIINDYAPALKKILDATNSWIDRNKPLAKSVEEVGASFGAVTAGVKALQVLGMLPGASGGLAVTAPAVLGSLLGMYNGSINAPLFDDQGHVIGGWGNDQHRDNPLYFNPLDKDYHPAPFISDWIHRHLPSWAGGAPAAAPGPGPRAGGGGGAAGNALDRPTVARAKLVHDELLKANIPGMTDARAWGFAANAVQESRADPNSAPGDMGSAHGLMMWRDSAGGGRRYTDYVNRYGHAPEAGDTKEAVDYIKYELTGSEAGAWRNIQQAGDTPGEAGAAISTFYERPKDTAAEEMRRWGIASRLSSMPKDSEPGSVHVTVHIGGHVPPGTKASAVPRGSATTSEPTIETALPEGY